MLRKTDLAVGIYMLAAIVFFIIPIPSFLFVVFLYMKSHIYLNHASITFVSS